jgi:CRISPR/Cas system Type II protein with McrA/HNH and RuvC-like nuclease domain
MYQDFILTVFVFGAILLFLGYSIIKDIKNYSTSSEEVKEYEINLGDNTQRSKHIPQNVKDDVWNRDGGKCVQCGTNENLEFDHIIPHSKGGANTYRNVQLLCESCNRQKSDNIG